MDTQIGTRPQIGALEIHQAYILASLNWLQQTRSLEMNHVAIEKAEKAKLLGFDHSSVITDAEKYMNNLETFKCYNFFSQNFPGCIILKEEDFINLNVKYGLVSGPLSYYKGDIPEDNLDEILATKTTLDSLTDNKYSNRNNALITNVKVNVRRISTPNPYSHYNFYREEPVSEGLIFLQYHKKELLAYPFAKYWNGRTEGVTMSHTACKSTDLFIAAPVDDMQQLVSFTETEIRVIPRSIDPFVFQVTPIGVVIYSKWGEEASDAIFDNVKPL